MNFADFSVNSQPIVMKFYTHYFPFMLWLVYPENFAKYWSILEVRTLDMQ